MTALSSIPYNRRRWPGHRGDDALLNLEVTCLNCGDIQYELEITTPPEFSSYQEYLADADSCPRCNETGTRVVARIYEGHLRPVRSA